VVILTTKVGNNKVSEGKEKGVGKIFLYAGGHEWANKNSRPLIIPQEIDEETAPEIPGAGCTWYPDEQPLSNEAV
jgi:hypothetical protein